MKKRTPKPEKAKPATDKSYSGRQKKITKPGKSVESGESTPRTFKKSPSDKSNNKEFKELGFRKNLRKRNNPNGEGSDKEVKKNSSASKNLKSTSSFSDKRENAKRSFNKLGPEDSFREEKKRGSRKTERESKNLRVSYRKDDRLEKTPESGPGKRQYGKSNSRDSKEGEQDRGLKKPFKPYTANKKETPSYKGKKANITKTPSDQETEEIRLNRYIANAGICSRREADELIATGLIRVNEKVITEMGYKVKPGDVIKYENRTLKREKLVYVLLNKPKDFITTTDDPEERKTVMDLVRNACNERIYPVGRLDRNTTGLLLLTNDGDLTEKLAHPSNNIKKLYQVLLDKPITDEDFQKIKEGVVLEDGKAMVDDLSIVVPSGTVLGIEIHIGKNRIVRRIFEHLGYEVLGLDRVIYAGLTKKDLPRGHWRFLTEKEVIQLKHFSS
ncbi:MAG TPA: pseudouridine synthase [Cytophagales bacterium]|nr:pseudouridine synthase [Cytophagales bacterium]